MPIEPTPVAPVTSHVPGSSRIPVLLVDDHPAVRVGARKLIDDQPDMAVVAEARSAEEALRQSGLPIGVAVVDYQLGNGHDGLWLTAQLKRLDQPPRVLVYSAFADNALTVMALIAGADGLLDKGELGQELPSSIRTLAQAGGTYRRSAHRWPVRCVHGWAGATRRFSECFSTLPRPR
jgi:DNA-binding NarL/FixJ family response regulator